MAEFMEFYMDRCYYEWIGNVRPTDAYYGRREEIFKRRKEQKRETLERRIQYNLGQASNLTRDDLGTEL